MNSKKRMTDREIIKLLDCLIGSTIPVADSAIDVEVEENLKTLIDIVNWCLDGIRDSATCRKSGYASSRDIGERAYAAMLEWKEWLVAVEESLA